MEVNKQNKIWHFRTITDKSMEKKSRFKEETNRALCMETVI